MPLDDSEAGDWVDREIASLRETVEAEGQGREAPQMPVHTRRRPSPSVNAIANVRARQPRLAEAVWLARRNRFELAFYVVSLASALGIGLWLALSGR
jgi:hypothetical protein